MQLCEPPAFTSTRTVRDIQTNRIDNLAAYQACAARMRRLVEWIKTAGDTP